LPRQAGIVLPKDDPDHLKAPVAIAEGRFSTCMKLRNYVTYGLVKYRCFVMFGRKTIPFFVYPNLLIRHTEICWASPG
jgi:hypothetical protein